MDNNVYCVIMAGGGGARLWPRSRRSMPKQFSRHLQHRKIVLAHNL